MKYKLEERADGLFRIRALRTFKCNGILIKKGELGGIVSGNDVLLHNDESWIDYDSKAIHSVVAHNSYIQNSKVVCSTIIGCSTVKDSDISYTECLHSILNNVNISGVYLLRCKISKCYVRGTGELIDCIGKKFQINVNTKLIGRILQNSDYIEFKNYSTSKRYLGYFSSTDTWTIGCFEGTTKELLKHLRTKATANQRTEYLQHVIQCRKLIHIEKHKRLSLWQSLWIELRTRLYK